MSTTSSDESDLTFESATETMADQGTSSLPAPTDPAGSGSGTGAGPTAQSPPGELVQPLAFSIVIPDLINGEIANVTQAAPKASVDRAYKWAAINALPHSEHVNAVGYVIRATYAQLMVTIGGNPTDSVKAEARRKAIVLGAVRAGAAAAYKLTVADFNSEETVSAGMAYDTGRITQSARGTTSANRWTLATSMSEPDTTEVSVIGMLVYLGMAVPVLQGASLVSSGHHFLPTTKNIFMGMKRQAVSLTSEAGKQWVESMGEMFDDLVFHKACHPISPPRKRSWAKKTAVAQRLHASGHGAAAIRLPAIPSDAAIGKTAIALALAARPTILTMGHNISVSTGRSYILALEAAEEGIAEREAVSNIQSWADTHMSSLAFCAGIVQHIHETSGTGRNTLLAAYSVRKLMAEHASEVTKGVTYARVAVSKTREAMERGNFSDPNIKM